MNYPTPARATLPGPLGPWESNLDDAVDHVSRRMAAVGGGVGRGGSPRRLSSKIEEAVGSRWAVRRATHPIGMSRGKQKLFGSCVWDGQPCRFDWWFPHLGIAVDEISEDELNQRFAEFEHRREWCDERCIIYTIIPRLDRRPGTEFVRQDMLDKLREAADGRRRELEELGERP